MKKYRPVATISRTSFSGGRNRVMGGDSATALGDSPVKKKALSVHGVDNCFELAWGVGA